MTEEMNGTEGFTMALVPLESSRPQPMKLGDRPDCAEYAGDPVRTVTLASWTDLGLWPGLQCREGENQIPTERPPVEQSPEY